MSNFEQLEQTQASNVLGQLQVGLANELNYFQNKANSWAQKNDIYDFIKNQSSTFDKSSQTINLLVNSGANYLLIYDLKGNFETGIGFNLTTFQQEPLPSDLLTEVSNDSVIWNLNNMDSTITGILLIHDEPLIIASSLIPSSFPDEPADHCLVFARYIDSAVLASLSRTVQSPVTFVLCSDWQASNSDSESSVLPLTFSKPVNSSYIVAYNVLKDITGDPAVILTVTMPRSVYVQGVITVNYIDRLLLVSCVVFSAAILLLLEFLFLSKLSRLNEAVSNITLRNNLSERLPTHGDDEIETLTKSINNMLGEIEDNTKKLQKAERFSAIGELATMIAHDLRNPLQGIANAIFYLKRKANPQTTDKEKAVLKIIEDDVKYSEKIVKDLLDYSKAYRLDLKEATPKELVWTSLSLVAVPEKIVLSDCTTDEPLVMVDKDSVKRVFVNILSNAVDAMSNGGTLKISCEVIDGFACFMFSDTGFGMSKETQEKLFQALFTTKAKGMGFGLSICKRIIDAHGGKIIVESAVGVGSTFKICLPLYDYSHK
ncbi:MAG: ATP-binding protein [Candidatus Bathyarchaeota archaeon]|nr:ATP-binding protein [Candidatus Bathyarchaeota archaeon]